MPRKLAIVTGATSGFGFATAKILLGKKFTVIVTSRNLERAQKAVNELRSEASLAIAMELDLNDLRSVASFASKFQSEYIAHGDTLVYLILNAGIVKLKQDIGPQGLEETYGTNHFGRKSCTKIT